MKVKRMEVSEILRRIWLFSSNKIKSSEPVIKQTNSSHCQTELIITAEIRNSLLEFQLEGYLLSIEFELNST